MFKRANEVEISSEKNKTLKKERSANKTKTKTAKKNKLLNKSRRFWKIMSRTTTPLSF